LYDFYSHIFVYKYSVKLMIHEEVIFNNNGDMCGKNTSAAQGIFIIE